MIAQLTTTQNQIDQEVNQLTNSSNSLSFSSNDLLSNDMFSQSNILEATSAMFDVGRAILEPLSIASALTLGKSFYPSTLPGMLAPANAAYESIGNALQPYINFGATFAKFGGLAITAASIGYSTYKGYQQGGPAGAIYNALNSTTDAAYSAGIIMTGAFLGGPIGGLIGVGVAGLYNLNADAIRNSPAYQSAMQTNIQNGYWPIMP